MVWWTPGWKFPEKLLIIKQGDTFAFSNYNWRNKASFQKLFKIGRIKKQKLAKRTAFDGGKETFVSKLHFSFAFPRFFTFFFFHCFTFLNIFILCSVFNSIYVKIVLQKIRQIILQIFANLFHEFILNLNFVKIVTDDD